MRGLLRYRERVVGVQTTGGNRSAPLVVLCAGAWTPEFSGWLGAETNQPSSNACPIEPLRGQPHGRGLSSCQRVSDRLRGDLTVRRDGNEDVVNALTLPLADVNPNSDGRRAHARRRQEAVRILHRLGTQDLQS